jgi:hypothetical protein
MTVAIYARVSSESQEARGTIGSQLEVLRLKMAELGSRWSMNISTTATPELASIVRVWTHCATPLKPVSSSTCGA